MTNASEALKQGAADWLKTTGESFRYYSALTGQYLVITATLEQDVSTVDDQGMFSRGLTLNINPVDVPNEGINRGDVATNSSGKRYRVDEVLDSPGYLTRVLVSPA